VILELRRYEKARNDDSRRVLTAYSRYEETPSELVLDYREGEYVAEGTRSETRRGDRLDIVLGLLPLKVPGLTLDEISTRWRADLGGAPAKRTLERDLAGAVAVGRAAKASLGKKGGPFRYYRSPDEIRDNSSLGVGSVGNRNESQLSIPDTSHPYTGDVSKPREPVQV
jgi:hypothetical protein